MENSPALPGFAAVIVAAGKGLRAGQPLPKQFANWCGKPVVRYSAEAFVRAGANPIVVVIPENAADLAEQSLSGLRGIRFVNGGTTRQESVQNALRSLAASAPATVLIHDAARPTVSPDVIGRLRAALLTHQGAIPVLPVVDSLSIDEGGMMAGSAERETLRRVQTPQAFNYQAIAEAHANWNGELTAGDDAQVLVAAGGKVVHVEGDEALKKLTFAEDFMANATSVRTGIGYDVHRLSAGEELWLGGVQIEHDKGLAGHSDADVALHAVVDALLGSIGAGDIGDHFPPSDPQWQGAASGKFAEFAAKLVVEAGYRIGNADLTIICEAPKIGPHKGAMREAIARFLAVDTDQVSVKATTTERLGFTGRGEGIAAQAVVTVLKDS